MLVALKEFSEIDELFRLFQAEHEIKLKDRPVFQNGLEYYEGAFQTDMIKLTQGLEKEIALVKQELDVMDRKKLEKIQSLLNLLDKEVPSIFNLDKPKLPQDEAIKTAVATMRKLPVFGSANGKVDFEWPTEKDLLAMKF